MRAGPLESFSFDFGEKVYRRIVSNVCEGSNNSASHHEIEFFEVGVWSPADTSRHQLWPFQPPAVNRATYKFNCVTASGLGVCLCCHCRCREVSAHRRAFGTVSAYKTNARVAELWRPIRTVMRASASEVLQNNNTNLETMTNEQVNDSRSLLATFLASNVFPCTCKLLRCPSRQGTSSVESSWLSECQSRCHGSPLTEEISIESRRSSS